MVVWFYYAAVAVVSVASSLVKGAQQSNAATARAAALERQARDEEALGSIDAADIQRETDFIHSRSTSIASADGGSASDVSVLRALANVEGEGRLRSGRRLYEARQRASEIRSGADVSRSQARAARTGAAASSATAVAGAAAQIGAR